MNMQPALTIAQARRIPAMTKRVSGPDADKRVDLTAIPEGGLLLHLRPRRLDDLAARTIDVMLSLTMLMLVAPIMAVLALVVRLDSTGPAIYRQERLGLGGKPFVVLKFRSMRIDAEAAGPAWASLRDPRVTRVGAFLRASRLDELPQLWNVLCGDMALIGPRPERPHFVETLSAEIPHFRERMAVKPGLTGWAQVNFRYGASIEDARTKLSYDLYYVLHRSFWMNVRILFGTAKVMLNQEGR